MLRRSVVSNVIKTIEAETKYLPLIKFTQQEHLRKVEKQFVEYLNELNQTVGSHFREGNAERNTAVQI